MPSQSSATEVIALNDLDNHSTSLANNNPFILPECVQAVHVPPQQGSGSRPTTDSQPQPPTVTLQPTSIPNRPSRYYDCLWKSLQWFWQIPKSLTKTCLIVALTIAILGVVPAWRAYSLSQWTARKDFLMLCRDNFDLISRVEQSRCKKALDRGLEPPPYAFVVMSKRSLESSQSSQTSPHAESISYIPATDIHLAIKWSVPLLLLCFALNALFWTMTDLFFHTTYFGLSRWLKVRFRKLVIALGLICTVLFSLVQYSYVARVLEQTANNEYKSFGDFCNTVQKRDRDFAPCMHALDLRYSPIARSNPAATQLEILCGVASLICAACSFHESIKALYNPSQDQVTDHECIQG